ncbi:hypothetical protein BGZ70_004199 [Mortierella alpina]|uniref:Uncharacterized protein n=1 Tax=Mortierella alpina TaxID=64518 RepID=A0A9P6IR54_MORAP|nr:hypothetical protein BGZ70_004199 [Mortierella alpina]
MKSAQPVLPSSLTAPVMPVKRKRHEDLDLASRTTKRQRLMPQQQGGMARARRLKREEARAWRRAQNRRQGERDLRKALSRHARAILHQKREEMAGWLRATSEAEVRVAQWLREEQEADEALQKEEAAEKVSWLAARQQEEQDREKRAEEEERAKARADKWRADQEAQRTAVLEAEAKRLAAASAKMAAEAEAERAAEAAAEAKRTAEAAANMAAEAESKAANGVEEAKARDDAMVDIQRAALEQHRQVLAGLREQASQGFVGVAKHAADRPKEEAGQRQLGGSALSGLSATWIHAKDRSAVPRSGGRTGQQPSPYCRPTRTTDPFSTSAPGQLLRGQVLESLTTPSGAGAAIKKHLFAVMTRTTQRTQRLRGVLPHQLSTPSPSVAALASASQGCPTLTARPRRSERLRRKARKLGDEVEALSEAMRKL